MIPRTNKIYIGQIQDYDGTSKGTLVSSDGTIFKFEEPLIDDEGLPAFPKYVLFRWDPSLHLVDKEDNFFAKDLKVLL